mmetsp:Transcript_52072/g.123986  ORF Transcript_52072/g.123986 Transcript_52072/m.123986 type:complete len:223 (-) Transcript_52072:675-1343(-)
MPRTQQLLSAPQNQCHQEPQAFEADLHPPPPLPQPQRVAPREMKAESRNLRMPQPEHFGRDPSGIGTAPVLLQTPTLLPLLRLLLQVPDQVHHLALSQMHPPQHLATCRANSQLVRRQRMTGPPPTTAGSGLARLWEELRYRAIPLQRTCVGLRRPQNPRTPVSCTRLQLPGQTQLWSRRTSLGQTKRLAAHLCPAGHHHLLLAAHASQTLAGQRARPPGSP